MRTSLFALVGIGVLVFAAPGTLAAQDYYSDIRPVLAENCMGCHSENGIAWSMEAADRTFARRRRIAEAVMDRRMPPWLAEPGHREYMGDISLDPSTVALFEAWADADFPEGEPRPDPAVGAPTTVAGHGGFHADLTLDVIPSGSYLPDQNSADEYRCFLVDWTPDERAYVTGFRAVPGNQDVAHHVVVYGVEPEMADRYRELEGEEEGDGYRCFGGALPDRLGQRDVRAAYEARYPDGVREMSRANWWLAHWAPGMDGHVFPEGTGIRLDPGSLLVVQMHYYTREARDTPDHDTRMDFMVASEVERPAFHLSQTNGRWLAGERLGSMVVPAGSMATYAYEDNLGDLLGYIGRLTDVEPERIQGLEVHSANLHMHAFGHSGRITLNDADGRLHTLLSVPRWDLRWQRDFTFAEPFAFTREQLRRTSIGVECTFENDTNGPVYGGYGSYDEMCFNFSYIAVREGEPAATQTGQR